MTSSRRTALTAGVLFILTMITGIAGVVAYGPVLSDSNYVTGAGADSRVFLRVVAKRMQAAGLKLINADVTVLAEAPRIAAHRAAMAANLSADLGVPAQLINIKATTTERLGFIGRGEGLAALASVLLGP